MIEEMTDFLLQKGKDLKLDEGIKALLVEHNGIISEEILNKYVQGFSLKTSSESPIGGGIGGSSSLVISILKAIYLFTENKSATNKYDLVKLAHNIEADLLRTPTGTQDYFPAVTGGMSFITYKAGDQRTITV